MPEQQPEQQPKQQPQEVPPTVIQDPALAEEMAHGEKPYREAAQHLRGIGHETTATELEDTALARGVEAGKKYVDEKQANLDRSKAQLKAGDKNAEAEKETPDLASPEVWGAMSPEQRETATEARKAMAEKLEKYGVTEDTLRVVETKDKEGNPTFTLLHTGAGVDIGDHNKDYDEARSYNSVMSKDNDGLFKFELNGKTYDARDGMTDAAYRAKVQDAMDRDVTLPDSKQLSKETRDNWTQTMLTGEPITSGGNVQVRDVDDGGVNGVMDDPESVDRGLRVCPAVVIKP